jgi:2-oxoglutarate ferredoxin oxidoreductase subunit alpha
VSAFNFSEIYRLPVFVLADEMIGHMSERVVIPKKADVVIVDRPQPKVGKDQYLPFESSSDMPAPMAVTGQGYHVHVTGLTHDERGYPVITDAVQERNVRHLVDKIRKNAQKIIRVETVGIEDATVVVVAYGCTARVARQAVENLRERGHKVGLLRLITIWPFPSALIRSIAGRVKAFVVPEINYGQIAYEVERTAGGAAEVLLLALMGGSIHSPEEIEEGVAEFL